MRVVFFEILVFLICVFFCVFLKLYFILYLEIILFGIFGVVYDIFIDVVFSILRVGVLILLGILGFVGGLKLGGLVMWFIEWIVVMIYVYMV